MPFEELTWRYPDTPRGYGGRWSGRSERGAPSTARTGTGSPARPEPVPAASGGRTLTVEDRAAASLSDIALELTERDTAITLTVVEKPDTPAPVSIDERITAALAAAGRPMPLGKLRARHSQASLDNPDVS